MKKKIVLCLLSLFALSACNGTKTSSNSENVKGWTDEQKKIMEDHLYGQVLPYFDFGDDTEVNYVSSYGNVVITGSATITKLSLVAYATLYAPEDGWTNYSDVYYYQFQKKVETSQGNRYIEVDFGVVNPDTSYYEDTGLFYLVAYDPFVYEFPTALFDEGTKESPYHVPSFKADYYAASTQMYRVKCYTSDQNAEATYKNTLSQQNGFKVLEDRNQYGYNVAISPDGLFAVGYAYLADEKALDIGLVQVPAIPTKDWPEAGLKAAFAKYKQDSFDVPKMTFEGAMYLGYEDEVANFDHVLYNELNKIVYTIEVHESKQENFNAYLSQLSTTDGWKEDTTASVAAEESSKVYTKEINGKIAKIDVYFNSNVTTINVYLHMEAKPVSAWPSDDIKKVLNNESITEELPSYSGDNATGYVVHEASYFEPAYVEILCDSTNVDSVFTAYVNLLTTNQWTAFEVGESENDYISPQKQLMVLVQKSESSVHVYFSEAPTKWPSEAIKDSINNEYIDDEVPALNNDSVKYYIFNEADALNSASVELICDSTNVDSVFTAYVQLLTNNEWTSYTTNGIDNQYISKNKELLVEVKKNESSVSIYFSVAPIKSWPTKFVSKQLAKYGYSDQLPEVTGDNLTFTYQVNPYSSSKNSFEIDVRPDIDSANAVVTLMQTYVSTLTSKGFKTSDKNDSSVDDEKFFISPSSQYEVEIWIKSNSQTLAILVTPVESK